MTSSNLESYGSGVKVQIIKEGDKKNFPKDGDNLVMHYVGKFHCGAQNGQTFDSSRKKQKPFKFQIGVGRVIKGWDVGVKQMSLGSTAVLKIGYDFGYGAKGYSDVIPPKQDLTFEVELLAINDTQSAAFASASKGGNKGGNKGGSKGVTVTIIKPGDGKTYPKAGNQLIMHYTGTFSGGKKDGQKFDSSLDRGQPFEFVIGQGQVIKGWDEGILQMSLGAKAILNIRSDYGYGASGYPPLIPKNQNLKFEVQLLSIK